jgi:hypothetical protein
LNYHAFDFLKIGDGFSLEKLLHPLSRTPIRCLH